MFRFRLEKVLRYRSRLVDEQSKAVREAAEKVAMLERRIAGLHAETKAQQERGLRVRQTEKNIDLWRRQTQFITGLRDQRILVEQELGLAEKELEIQRLQLVAVNRDKEVLERLKEKQHEAWQQEQRRRETKELDEIAAVRAAVAR